MSKFLLDTNICIYFLKCQYNLDQKLEKIKLENCFISEITIAELKFGAKNSESKEKNRNTVDDFDLLIGATAISNNLILVTRNVSDFERLEGIQIENWVTD